MKIYRIEQAATGQVYARESHVSLGEYRALVRQEQACDTYVWSSLPLHALCVGGWTLEVHDAY